MWAKVLVILPLFISGAAATCQIEEGNCAEEDYTSLLQVSQGSMQDNSKRIAQAWMGKQDGLRERIQQTRAGLEQMEKALAYMQSEENQKTVGEHGISLLQMPSGQSFAQTTGGQDFMLPPVGEQQEAMAMPTMPTMPMMQQPMMQQQPMQQQAAMPMQQPAPASLLEAGPAMLSQMNAAPMMNAAPNMASGMDMDQSTMFSNWQGMAMPQFEASESYVMGQGCKLLPNILNIGGPAALPNILSNKVVLYAKAGYKGHKLRDAVASAFAEQLPGTGPWNVAAGKIDWNLYNEGKACTVAVKLPEWGLDWLVYGGR